MTRAQLSFVVATICNDPDWYTKIRPYSVLLKSFKSFYPSGSLLGHKIDTSQVQIDPEVPKLEKLAVRVPKKALSRYIIGPKGL